MRVIARQAASGHDTVNVGMMLQLLIPRVEHAEKTDLRAEDASGSAAISIKVWALQQKSSP